MNEQRLQQLKRSSMQETGKGALIYDLSVWESCTDGAFLFCLKCAACGHTQIVSHPLVPPLNGNAAFFLCKGCFPPLCCKDKGAATANRCLYLPACMCAAITSLEVYQRHVWESCGEKWPRTTSHLTVHLKIFWGEPAQPQRSCTSMSPRKAPLPH